MPKSWSQNPPLAYLLVVALACVWGCSGPQTISETDEEPSYLELDVEPKTAEIYIDDNYQGTVDGWREHVVPIEPGFRRVELRAEGHIAQRFDVDVTRDRWITLRVRLEPNIASPGADEFDDDIMDDDQRPVDEVDRLDAPPHPATPEPNS